MVQSPHPLPWQAPGSQPVAVARRLFGGPSRPREGWRALTQASSPLHASGSPCVPGVPAPCPAPAEHKPPSLHFWLFLPVNIQPHHILGAGLRGAPETHASDPLPLLPRLSSFHAPSRGNSRVSISTSCLGESPCTQYPPPAPGPEAHDWASLCSGRISMARVYQL